MATTDYDYLSTRNQIIERALRIVGTGVPPGQSLPAAQLLGAVQALNELVKDLQSDHIFLWTIKTLTQALSSTVASYSLASTDPAVIWIENAYLRISSNDHPLEQISYTEYLDIAVKTQPGQPTQFCIDDNRSPTLYVWPVPTASLTMYYTAATKLQDWESASGTADMPAKFQRALVYTLAADLCDEYGVPPAARDRIEQKAAMLMTRAKAGEHSRSDIQQMDSAFTIRTK